ncbi:MAG: hypothetical protein EOO38_06935, partial [Cytophagaceae bacterium]
MSEITINNAGTPVPIPDTTQAQAHAGDLKQGQHIVGANVAVAQPFATDAVQSADIGLQGKSVSHASVNGDAPLLPEPAGASAPAKDVLRVVSDPLAAMGTGLFAAMQAMTKARQSDMTLGLKIKTQMGMNQVQAKKDEMAHKEDEIDGQRASSVTKLAGAIAGTAASGLMGYRGAKSEIAQDAPVGAKNGDVVVNRVARDATTDPKPAVSLDQASVAGKKQEQDALQNSLAEKQKGTAEPTSPSASKAEKDAAQKQYEASQEAASSTVH